jgi:protein-tyrosine phosphatase
MIDAHRIAPKLYIGSIPPNNLAEHGFDVSVLCAAEDIHARDVRHTLRVPLDDVETKMSPQLLGMAVAAADRINDYRAEGLRVLVTCQAGVNRSSFVAALALVRSGWTPAGAIDRIRRNRVPPIGMTPLSNRMFRKLIRHVADKPGTAASAWLWRGRA